jgi:ribulose bisphosphate carboxylase small subunit
MVAPSLRGRKARHRGFPERVIGARAYDPNQIPKDMVTQLNYALESGFRPAVCHNDAPKTTPVAIKARPVKSAGHG